MKKRLDVPFTLTLSRESAVKQLNLAKRTDWVKAIGEEPLDGRVLWTIEENHVTLHWRPPAQEPSPLAGGDR